MIVVEGAHELGQHNFSMLIFREQFQKRLIGFELQVVVAVGRAANAKILQLCDGRSCGARRQGGKRKKYRQNRAC
jgi:hypothetical protein